MKRLSYVTLMVVVFMITTCQSVGTGNNQDNEIAKGAYRQAFDEFVSQSFYVK